MKLIKPSFEIIEQEPGKVGMLKHIEKTGRTCYKSEDKIWDTLYYVLSLYDKDYKLKPIITELRNFANENPTECVVNTSSVGEVSFISIKSKYLDKFPELNEYKSCSQIEDEPLFVDLGNSAEQFVKMLQNKGHGAMLEHGTVYLKIPSDVKDSILIYNKYRYNKYSYINTPEEGSLGDILNLYVITNYRVLIENNWLDDLQYMCEPTEHHEKRVTVKFICDRGVSHEYMRHRVFSFAQESTRYCNYSNKKFGKEITYIIPCWMNIKEGSYKLDWDVIDSNGNSVEEFPYPEDARQVSYWFNGCPGGEHLTSDSERDDYLSTLQAAEWKYFDLIEKHGWIAQQARDILPNSLKTELIMTGTIEQWKGFFELRCANSAHPQARELAIPLKEEFEKRGWL